jgi:predicted transcriptional regulator
MGSHRGRLRIIADILSIARDGARKTLIMYRANLSYSLLVRYLNEVLDADLVFVDDNKIYQLTQNGQDFLERFDDYLKRRGRLERQLDRINDTKVALENIVSNTSNKHSQNPPAKQR